MALTAAERAKRYRDKKKRDTETHNEYLQKERERYYRRKASGEFSITNKSQRAQSYIRRKWRVKLKERREKEKNKIKGITFMTENSPANSPVRNDELHGPVVQDNVRVRQVNHQSITGNKRRNRNRARSYRKLYQLSKEKDRYKTLWECSRKTCQRLRKKYQEKRSSATHSKRTRLTKLKHTKPIKTRQVTRLVKKIYSRTGHSVSWNIDTRRRIRHFLEEDIHSTQAPGKKDTITRKKRKMQKRYLNDTLLNLYKSFTERYPGMKISYVSFCRMRPFWVIHKKVESRDTCLCKVHENVKMRVQKLHRLKVINDSKPDQLLDQLVCDTKSKVCAYGECETCKHAKLTTTNTYTDEMSCTQVTYTQWVNRTEEFQTKDGTKTVNKVIKIEEKETIETLLKETTILMKEKYVRHVFNIKHQYKAMKDTRDNLNESEAVINIDFSENYNGKLAEEIQTMHFGGNRKQISLHTVVVHTAGTTESVCTISNNTKHGPGAIWAHMKPELVDLKEKHPNVDTLHFVSNGPSTQYRSKNNFYLYYKEIIGRYGFKRSTWNFTETGHGKSAADGVGGTVKRTADRLVAHGADINDAATFFEKVGQELKSIQLHLISSDDIDTYTETIPASLKTIKGTMKIHQLLIDSERRGSLGLKVLSCFCRWPNRCSCYLGDTEEHVLESEIQTVQNTADVDCRPEAIEASKPHHDMVGEWCAIYYDREAYPGIIQDLSEEQVEVKCMARMGSNRFFWPLLEDILWYPWLDFLMSIPEPQPVTSRHVQIDPGKWTLISQLMDDKYNEK